MAKTWEKFYDEVLPDVPGCSQPMAKNAIRNAAIEFFGRSWTWRADHPAIDAVANQAAYPYALTNGQKVAMPLAVWYDGKPLTAKTQGELESMYADWRSQVGTPLYYLQEGYEALMLVPKPAASLTGAIELKVAVQPSRDSADLPDEMWENCLDAIASGAKARLFAMKKKPWTDPQRAAYHQGLFDRAVAAAKSSATRGRVRSRARVRAHFI